MFAVFIHKELATELRAGRSTDGQAYILRQATESMLSETQRDSSLENPRRDETIWYEMKWNDDSVYIIL